MNYLWAIKSLEFWPSGTKNQNSAAVYRGVNSMISYEYSSQFSEDCSSSNYSFINNDWRSKKNVSKSKISKKKNPEIQLAYYMFVDCKSR